MIPFNIPLNLGEEKKYVNEAIDSYKIAGDGVYTKKCEELLQELLGVKKVFLTCSGTAALEMAYLLANIEKDDEIICPSFTFSTSACAGALFGGKIAFVDCRKDNMNIDEEKIEQAINSKTKALLVMHYGSVACNMERIVEICNKHSLFLIEDAAQALDAYYKGKALGTFGQAGCFSFHATKNLAMGEGGALCLNDDELIERAHHLWDSGTDAYDFERGMVSAYSWVDLGSSFLPSELQAAYLYPQLLNAASIKEKRVMLWYSYRRQLKELVDQGKLEIQELDKNCDINGHLFYIKCKDEAERESLRLYLKEKEISAVFHYSPLHSSKAGKKYGYLVGEDKYTTTESKRLLRLPMYYDLKDSEVSEVVEAIKTFYEER